MDFFDVIHQRHSIRHFIKKTVEKEKIDSILDAANSAPSAGNLQAYEIFIIEDSHLKRALADAALGQESIMEAPVVFVFFSNPMRSAVKYGKRGAELYALQDATIAAAYSQLAATAVGLGSVWVGAFNEDAVTAALGLGTSSDIKPVAIIPIGYPAEKPRKTPRRRLDDIVHCR
jgi:nitroreductase